MDNNIKFVIKLFRNGLLTLFMAVLFCVVGSCTKDDTDYESKYEFISSIYY